MKTDEMIRCLNTVADYMSKKDESPRCTGDLRRIAEHLEESRTKNNRQVDAGVRQPKFSHLTEGKLQNMYAGLKQAIRLHENGSLPLINEAVKDYKNDITILEQILAI